MGVRTFIQGFGILTAVTASVPGAAEYYLAVNGNDASDGHSAATAWKTLGKINGQTFVPGDRILLQGGATFSGSLVLKGSGNVGSPIRLGSFGMGRALIDAGPGTGLRTSGAHVWVGNLDFRGSGRKTGNSGNGIQAQNATGVRIDSVSVSGFQHSGISLSGGTHGRVTHAHAFENGYAGILVSGNDSAYVGYSVVENNPGDPTVTNNHSGSGILLTGMKGAVVEHCEAFNNGWDMQQSNVNGPVGIWTANSDGVVIQYCISHNNRSPAGKTDGGGFDIDGGAVNATVQYCYAYDNGGTGYLLCTYAGSGTVLRNATVRYNISENDGQLTHKAGLLFYDCCGTGFPGTEIYNNVIYNDRGRHGIQMVGNATVGQGANFRNNILITKGTGRQIDNPGKAVYRGNCYWTDGGGFAVGAYKTLEAWANATGQEMEGGILAGLNANPQLVAAGIGEKLKDPALLTTLAAYRLRPTSPLIGRGIDLRTLSTGMIQPGTRDFFGNPLRLSGRPAIGAHEFNAAIAIRAEAGSARLDPAAPRHDPKASRDALGRIGRSAEWAKLFRVARALEIQAGK